MSMKDRMLELAALAEENRIKKVKLIRDSEEYKKILNALEKAALEGLNTTEITENKLVGALWGSYALRKALNEDGVSLQTIPKGLSLKLPEITQEENSIEAHDLILQEYMNADAVLSQVFVPQDDQIRAETTQKTILFMCETLGLSVEGVTD